MNALREFACRLLRDETGATMVEFALVLTLCSMVALGGFIFVQWNASNQIQGTGSRMTVQAANPS